MTTSYAAVRYGVCASNFCEEFFDAREQRTNVDENRYLLQFMPELPEVENLVLQLRSGLSGRSLLRMKVWTPSILSGPLLKGETALSSVSRRGKYLCFTFSSAGELWVHLGMTGQLLLSEKETPRQKHDHALFLFSGGLRLVFRDVRRFGGLFSRRNPSEPLTKGIAALGPDPFEISAEEFASLMKKRTGLIKSLLLNQSLVSGIGNIYADESLHRAGIHPKRRAGTVKKERLESLHRKICEVLNEAIAEGGSSINDYMHLNGRSGQFQNLHRVYGKEAKPCLVCSLPIRRIRIASRSSFFCIRCQK